MKSSEASSSSVGLRSASRSTKVTAKASFEKRLPNALEQLLIFPYRCTKADTYSDRATNSSRTVRRVPALMHIVGSVPWKIIRLMLVFTRLPWYSNAFLLSCIHHLSLSLFSLSSSIVVMENLSCAGNTTHTAVLLLINVFVDIMNMSAAVSVRRSSQRKTNRVMGHAGSQSHSRQTTQSRVKV